MKQATRSRRRATGIGAALMALFASSVAHADSTWEYAVRAGAEVQSSPPKITLRWVQDTIQTPTSYAVSRKPRDTGAWGPAVVLPGSATSWTDDGVTVGSAFEYQIVKSTSLGYTGTGYVYAGIDAPLVDDRGGVLLVVDATHAAALATELARLEDDLVGDGWTVTRIDASPNDPPPKVKEAIQKAYAADPKRVNSVLLFGRVAVPYSGDMNPDAHPEHRGAWPADVYYGDVDGAWTDTKITSTSGESARNRNVPGDGKFDQVSPPSRVELAVGRVDLANMPGKVTYDGPPTFPSEEALLRQYLDKDHAFRHKLFSPKRRALIRDGFGDMNGEAFAASGWRNFSALVGSAAITVPSAPATFISTLQNEDYLWAYGCGGGSPSTIAGLGADGPYQAARTLDVVNADIRAPFVFLFGSWLGDWDSEDNILRSVLATKTMGLVSAWSGRPHWFVHTMALGETIGAAARLTQNNRDGVYTTQVDTASAGVHVALMGDPTLRMHVVAPPANARASAEPGAVRVSFTASPDAVLGYHVYRAASRKGPFARVTRDVVTTTSWLDADAPKSAAVYMVRAIAREQSASGTYFNASQGIFAASDGAGPNAPGDSSAGAGDPGGAVLPQGAPPDASDSGCQAGAGSSPSLPFSVLSALGIAAVALARRFRAARRSRGAARV